MQCLADLSIANEGLTAENAKLTAENAKLTAANTKLTAELEQVTGDYFLLLEVSGVKWLKDANRQLLFEKIQLKTKNETQASYIKQMMQDRRVMLEEVQRQEALLEKLQMETREQKDCFAALLKDLTLTLTSLQNEAEQAAAAFREAAEPLSTGYQSEHEKLLNQLRNMHNEQATCNNAIIGDFFEVAQNTKGQWTMRCCVAYDPDPKASPIDCEWQLWDKNNEQATCNNAIIGDFFEVVRNTKGQWTMRNNKKWCVAYDPHPKASPIDCEWQLWDKDLQMFVVRGRVSKLPKSA